LDWWIFHFEGLFQAVKMALGSGWIWVPIWALDLGLVRSGRPVGNLVVEHKMAENRTFGRQLFSDGGDPIFLLVIAAFPIYPFVVLDRYFG
jgi:hypothetical protein